jgi:hypothetical protein
MCVVNCWWFADNDFGSWPFDEKDLSVLPPGVRRRLTPLGRRAFQVVNQCSANVDDKSIPWVVSCRFGDISHRLNLLSSLAEGEMLSPTDFSMSVHNAIIGLHSITTGNKHTYNAIAGGACSFEVGLLDSIALLKEKGGTVGYIYYDYLGTNPATGQLDDFSKMECLALILGEGVGEMKIEYSKLNNLDNCVIFELSELIGYFKNDEKKYRMPVAGGEILFECTISKA